MQAKEMANFRSYKNQLLSNGETPQDGLTELDMSNLFELYEMEDEEAKQ